MFDFKDYECIEYKGFYVEHNIYGRDECTVHYCGDDVWFESKEEAIEFIDYITDEKNCI